MGKYSTKKHRRYYWLQKKHRRHISGSRLSNSKWKVAKTQAKLACVYLAQHEHELEHEHEHRRELEHESEHKHELKPEYEYDS
jgi:hypothetical protein